MRFDWDEQKAATNLAKHYPDPKHSRTEQRWITIGLSETGRVLVVSHTGEDERVTRIISARRATSKERRFYEEG